jgi:thiol-disulfide isomerase/thioredoxin
MVERLLILTFVILVVVVLWAMWRWWQQRWVGELRQECLPAALTQQVTVGQPAVLYFTSDGCIQCKVQQTPVLERFAASTGVPVHRLDAVEQSDLAAFYGVMTLPTTVVLDPQRRPVAINYGVAPLQKLREQVEAAVI